MWPPPPRLIWHSLVALVLLASGVLAPALLLSYLFHKGLGTAALVLGVTLLAVGSAALIGGALSRGIDSSACSKLQWRCMLVAVWTLNPVLVTVVSAATDNVEVAWWSGLPLALALTLLSGRLQLAPRDPNWIEEGCLFSPLLSIYWLLNRLVLIGLPFCLLSFQVTLYLPSYSMSPKGPQIGLFVCGGCVLISAKFCAMCACLAPGPDGRQRLPQALVLVILLSADWISSLHLMVREMITDDMKATLLLSLLLVAGLIQLRIALGRLRLCQRWQRALAQRRARELGANRELGDPELTVEMNAGRGESSDSDDDRGPGSLPDGFHEALMGVLGVPAASTGQVRREWLCGTRRALVLPPPGGAQAAAGPPLASAAGVALAPPSLAARGALQQAGSSSAPGPAVAPADADAAGLSDDGTPGQPAPLEIAPDERICTVCQEDIKTGEKVRPLPKCSHVFHAQCLEGWAKVKQEGTRCPTCRRPALARKQVEGATSISALTACEECDAASAGASGAARGPRAGPRPEPAGDAAGAGAGPRPGQVRRPAQPPGRPAGAGPRRNPSQARGFSASALRATLGVSEAFANAALDCVEGHPDHAANLILEHRSLLAEAFGGEEVPPATPPGVAEAVIEANPNLAGLDAHLRRQLIRLYGSGRLMDRRPWAALPPMRRAEVFRMLLEEVLAVVRRRDERN